MEWQPIETAPKDGSMYIVCEFLSNGEPYWIGVQRWQEPVWEGGKAEAEMVTVEGGESDYTHWMPLPSPPSDNEKEHGTPA